MDMAVKAVLKLELVVDMVFKEVSKSVLAVIKKVDFLAMEDLKDL